MIEKNGFLREVSKLKGHRKPKKINKYRINDKIGIKSHIMNYQRGVKHRHIESHFDTYIEKIDERQRRKLLNELIYWEYRNETESDISARIVPASELHSIIKVSERTIARWEKKGVIQKRIFLIEGIINVPAKERVSAREFRYYDLSEIIAELKQL
jgi:hypothetical protein